METLTLVKIGGSLITDKSQKNTARPEVITRLGKEIKAADLSSRILVGHGGGSFGHYLVTQMGAESRTPQKAAQVRASVQVLHRQVLNLWSGLGLSVKGLSPGESWREGRLDMGANLASDSLLVLHGDMVPVDDTQWTVCSTEMVFAHLIEQCSADIKIREVLLVTDVDGLIDPLSGSVIEVINQDNFADMKSKIFASNVPDVTGAMELKLTMAKKWSEQGIRTIILNGGVPGRLRGYLSGEKTICTQCF